MKHVAHVLKGTACNIFIFLVLFALQACMFIVQVGPLTIPDPDMHPLSTYALATGQSLNPVAKGKDAHGNTVKQQSIEGDSRLLTIPGFANVLIVESISRATQGDSSRETQQSADDVMADHIVVPDGTHTNRSNAYFPPENRHAGEFATVRAVAGGANIQQHSVCDYGVLCHCAVTALEIADGVAISYSTGGVCGIEPDD